MQQFEIVLKNEKRKFYDRFAIFLFILNGIAVCFFLARSDLQQLSQGSFPGLIILALSLFLAGLLVFSKSARQKKYAFIIASSCIVLYWALLNHWWIALIMTVLLALYSISKRQLKVIIRNDHIFYPSFPARKFGWEKLNNILLKDGLLTIDLYNNKIIQQMIDEEKTTVNEKEFNEFCKQQLQKARTSA